MPVEVRCEPATNGWHCRVVVGADASATTHEVSVGRKTLQRLRPGTDDPAPLVRDAFAFLLVREPRESILRAFDLEEIGRYFPRWEDALAVQGR